MATLGGTSETKKALSRGVSVCVQNFAIRLGWGWWGVVGNKAKDSLEKAITNSVADRVKFKFFQLMN